MDILLLTTPGGRLPWALISLMASRQAQKEAARQRRVAEEQAAQAKVQRTRRMQMLGGVLVAVIVAIAVVVIVSTHGNKSAPKISDTKATNSNAAQVNSLLKGIPQSGNTLGNPNAKVTFTEYGDLECPICKEFSEGAEEQLIKNEVRTGKVKLVYKSFETASRDPQAAPNAFMLQQTAAYAAGAQNKAWNYILLFYREQQTENTPYVTASFLTSLAKAVPGLNRKTWSSQRFNPKYSSQVISENKFAAAMPFQGGPTSAGTPALIASSSSKQTKAIAGDLSYSAVQSLIKQVS
jgi:protein-disulfide isomerase